MGVEAVKYRFNRSSRDQSSSLELNGHQEKRLSGECVTRLRQPACGCLQFSIERINNTERRESHRLVLKFTAM